MKVPRRQDPMSGCFVILLTRPDTPEAYGGFAAVISTRIAVGLSSDSECFSKARGWRSTPRRNWQPVRHYFSGNDDTPSQTGKVRAGTRLKPGACHPFCTRNLSGW